MHCAELLATGNYKMFATILKIFFIIHHLVHDQVSVWKPPLDMNPENINHAGVGQFKSCKVSSNNQ